MPSQQQCMAHQQAHGCQSCDSLRQRALIPCLVRPLVDVEAVAIGDGVYKSSVSSKKERNGSSNREILFDANPTISVMRADWWRSR